MTIVPVHKRLEAVFEFYKNRSTWYKITHNLSLRNHMERELKKICKELNTKGSKIREGATNIRK